MLHYNDVAHAIKERRKTLKINQEVLAEITGVSIRTIKAIESNTTNPNFHTILTILDVLGMKLEITTKK